jgi:Nif-specific regulatory protein
MAEVWRRVGQVAGTSETVLLLGEPGTGQDLLAEEIHRRSAVSAGPFVRFNGTALPESMVESELFGHAKGVGGRFEEAHGGTLFLDEVGDLSLAVQARLLRVLEEGTVGRAGSSRSVAVHLRLVASTSRNLEARIAAGRFRADLAARLSAFPIQVPPLRDRGADIIAIADRLVTDFSLQTGKTIMRISTPALEMLLTYPWPGNVRELEDVLERAVLLSDDEVIHGYHLPPSLQSSVHSGTRMHGRLEDRLDSLEYEMLVEALKASRGNVTQAARELGLTKRIMGLRLKKYELDYRPFRQGPADLAEDEDES